MPFKSDAQRRYLYSQHPDVAKKFAAETPKGADLPEHVKKKKREMSAMMDKMLRGH